MPRDPNPHHAYQAGLFGQWNEWNSEASAALRLYRHARAYRNLHFDREERAVHQSRYALMSAIADLRDAEGEDWEHHRDMVEAKRKAFEASVATLRARTRTAQA